MVFSSVTFLFYFLPLVLITIRFARSVTTANWVLLAFSLIFYIYGEAENVIILLTVVVATYALTLLASRLDGRDGKLVFGLAVVFNLSVLGYFKYANFLADNVAWLIGSAPVGWDKVQLPLGISFFVFHAISYIVDVRRRVAPAQKRLDVLTLYIVFFPQLIAGPIVRYHEIAHQLISRTITQEDFVVGARRFIGGLAKKVLIANPIGVTVDQIFALPAAELSFELAWLGAILYALQLYFDFSGYSDMAIGLARMFGFRFPENFNYPYISQSIREFWRRWHITLSNWFRDYLYVPLGGNRKSGGRTYLNLLIVFFLCGLWHGAAWNFVVWGLWHGLFLVLERLGLGEVLDRAWRPIRHFYAGLVVLIGWVFFRAANLDQAMLFLSRMADIRSFSFSLYPLEVYFSTEILALTALAVALSTPFAARLAAAGEEMASRTTRLRPGFSMAVALIPIGGLLLSAMALTAQTHNPFLYFRF
jgi:alginate O-acetyltransferase complex protein AlgI